MPGFALTNVSSTTAGSASFDVWPLWASSAYQPTTVASNSVSNGVWRMWVTNTAATSTNAIITSAIWGAWSAPQIAIPTHAAPPPLTPEQRAAQDKYAAEQRERQRVIDEEVRALQAKNAQAKKRARKLLVDHLSRAQRECYEKNGYFDVRVDGKLYRIEQGAHGNVKLLDEQSLAPIESYCVQPAGVPDEDVMLSQKLALEMAREEFFRKANIRRYPRN